MKRLLLTAVWSFTTLSFVAGASAQLAPGQPPAGPPPEYPPFAEVSKGHDQVVSTTDGQPSLYGIWVRKKDSHVLAELPRDFAAKKHFIALTVASGETYAGLQGNSLIVYWRQYDKRLALIEPNLGTRSTGDPESQSSVKRIFTDRVLLDVPIVTMGPHGGPVIDASALLVGQAARFFGGAGQSMAPQLATVKTAKAFPKNVELAFEAPMGGGRLKTLHYSISEIPEASGYKPRAADQRIGYFTTSYADLGKFQEDGTRTRYINRWRVEKRDPALKLSPPKNPIVFYIEQSTPVRYRPYVKQGILAWNAAFEKIGIRECIEVRQQDAVTGENMDKDPEDVRYNFVRWLSNNQGTAIGPSRAHPYTGEILDADIILTDGWIRHYIMQQADVLPQLATDGFSPQTLAWLERRPKWDPRLLLVSPAKREEILAQRERAVMIDAARSAGANGETPAAAGARPCPCALCEAAQGLATDMAMLSMSLDLLDVDGALSADAPKDVLDGMPDEYVGPLIAHLTAHEVGHTLGLRHNFKASSAYSLADVNNPDNKAKFAGSVMDYLPININLRDGKLQSNFAMNGIGPYDMWAIEYGYTFQEDLKPILARVAEPELAYATDEDTWGPDPLARRYDFAANPLEYARNQIELIKQQRGKILDKYVKDGQSWAKARRGYETTLGLQTRTLTFMADWLGGAFVNRDRKGDPKGRAPLEVAPVLAQRDALKFVIENAFVDSAFGLTPELLTRLSYDQWIEEVEGSILGLPDPAWPVHDRIMGIQSSVMTMLLKPDTLTLVYDNELRTPADADMLTLPELLDAVGAAVWSELDSAPPGGASARKPWISSLRRNLQNEHVERLIDLMMPDAGFGPVHKPISNLAVARLDALRKKIAKALETPGLDPYTSAHLTEAQLRISKALDAQLIYNIKDAAQAPQLRFFFGQQREE